ncbi:MAG: M20/M25/M40 family metallo-hydrolase [Anaerolineae bacterium]|nr:M20/M25/M40 family metallo-hydrolase [Anaerolineae bacterium]MDK1081768.1 M20/M25/M40 family metallo-hydrolase [Anaerolineae bacterium]MDK1119417.1 M20/M25/M40 family metallo-hydrolase [Anaerolineae bacterium]
MLNPHLPLDQKITGDIYTSDEAMKNLSKLCDEFGSRFGGTKGERLAAEFIQSKLEDYGLDNVHTENVEYLGWTRGKASLEIITPIMKSIPCISLPHSPPVDLEAEIINLEDGAPADFDSKSDNIKGKIVLVTSVFSPKDIKRWVHRKEKYGRSLLADAKGFIFINHYRGYGPATGGIGFEGQAGPIPGISISLEDGEFIKRLLERQGLIKIRIKTSDSLSHMISWNIIGDLPGKVFPKEVVMLGSHYDGHDISQGAVDPASGVIAVLEAARVLAKYGGALARTIRFAFWGVEEIGLLGSKSYVKEHFDDLKNIRFYLNMDAAGNGLPKDINLHGWPELNATFERYQKEMRLDFAIGQNFHDASDHYPLLLAGIITGGIEAVRATSTGRGYGHTKYDTFDKVNQTDVRAAAALGARLALRIASEDVWPAKQRNQAAITNLLNQPDQKDLNDFNQKISAYFEKLT